ncbi:two-component system response regulator, partial [Elusimicrobiota bacterium]
MIYIEEQISKGKILIVDDEPSVRYVLKHKLSLLGYKTYETGTAADAIEYVNNIQPDIVLLDIKLPDTSGHNVLNSIRANPATKFLPVIMITGVTNQLEKITAIENGVNDFVVKPFDWKELTVRVNSLINYKQLVDELEEAEGVVVSLAKTIDARDSYTAGHSERVSTYAYELGKQIGLPDTDLLSSPERLSTPLL